jgi:hypothetical protein
MGHMLMPGPGSGDPRECKAGATPVNHKCTECWAEVGVGFAVQLSCRAVQGLQWFWWDAEGQTQEASDTVVEKKGQARGIFWNQLKE